MSGKRTAISCTNLTKKFGKNHVLRNINITLEEGSLLALLGPMGAGKTTMLKIIATLIIPDEGKASVFDYDTVRDAGEVRKRIGFISSEDRSMYWRLSGRQNLRFFGSLQGMERHQVDQNIEKLSEIFGLQKKINQKVKDYSTGMRQTLAILRGLLHDPAVILIDEPTRSLSLDIALKVRSYLREKVEKEGKTVLLASHDIGEVDAVADQAAYIDEGVIKALGAPKLIKKDIAFFRNSSNSGGISGRES